MARLDILLLKALGTQSMIAMYDAFWRSVRPIEVINSTLSLLAVRTSIAHVFGGFTWPEMDVEVRAVDVVETFGVAHHAGTERE